jgi:PAS domain S-box-containing protein
VGKSNTLDVWYGGMPEPNHTVREHGGVFPTEENRQGNRTQRLAMLDQQDLYDIHDAIQDILLVLDRNGLRILHANRAAQVITGYTQAELSTLTLPHLFPGFRREDTGDFIALLAANGETRHAATLLSRDGTPIPTEIRIALGQTRHVPCLVCVARDTTNQIATELELRRNEALYRSLVKAMPDLLFRIRRDGLYLDFNMPENFGLPIPKPEDIIGKKVKDVVPEHVTRLAMPAIERVLQTGKMETIEYEIEEQNGVHSYEARFVASMEDEVVAVVRDITERRRTEEALRESEATARALLNAPMDSALLVNTDWMILDINQAAAWEFGKTVDEMIGTSILDCLPPGMRQSYQTQAAEVFLTGKPLNYEERYDGLYFAHTVYPLFDTKGNVTRLALYERDITRQKKTEEALRRQRAILEGVAQATGRLLANHDCAAAIRETLAILGEATGVDRVFIFENHARPVTGEMATSYRYEWTNGLVHSEAETPFLQNLAWEAAGLADYYSQLAAGEVIVDADGLRQRILRLGPEARVLSNICSLLIVPIFANGQFWGSIGFDDRHTRRQWAEEEISVIRLLAASIGAAIERQQTEDKLRAEREISDTLREIGMALTSTLDLDEVLGRLLVQAKRVVSYDAANVMLLENGTACIVQSVGYETPDLPHKNLVGTSFRVEKTPLMRKMMQTGMPDFSLDVRANPDWVKLLEAEWVRSWLGVPILVRGKVVGFFSFDSAQEGVYGPEHIRLIMPIARQAAIAIENATLFANIRELERIKSEMIRIASHDLRSPLTRLRALSQRLADQPDHLITPEQCHDFSMIREAVDDMERMISDILSLERIEARFREAQPISWNQLIEQSLKTLRADLEAKHHTLTVKYALTLPAVRGDPVQLGHAVFNLIQNAIKYTPPGGQIAVRVFRRNYGGRPRIVFEVQDNGIGIPLEQQEKLFEPYYRVQQPGTENISGRGLGLSVVKAAVEYHKGRVYVDSTTGEGSLFGFWVPV